MKKSPASTNNNKAGKLKNDTHWCLHPWRASKQISVSPANALRLINWSPHMVQAPFKLLLLCWVPGQVGLCASPFKSEFSISYSPMVLLEVNPIGFQDQTLWDLISLVQFPTVGRPERRHKPSLLRDELQTIRSPPNYGSLFLNVGVAC